MERKELEIRGVSSERSSFYCFCSILAHCLTVLPRRSTDSGEPGKLITTRKGQSAKLKKWLGRVKSRQETFFSRVKSFNVMKNRFRHGKRGTKDKMNRHKLCFESIVVLLAYDIEVNPLFQV